MPNQWNKGDILKLIADCELGKYGDVLHVTSVAGPYMTATVQRRDAPDPVVHTGRDYAYAVKIGTFEPDDEPLFSWAGDVLGECETKLRELYLRLRDVPTARTHAASVLRICDQIEGIAEDLASADHTGGP